MPDRDMPDRDGEPEDLLIESLTGRELEILRCLAEGLTNQETANRLHVALTTVKWYNTQIFGKLGVQNRQEAIERAHDLGLLLPEVSTVEVPNDLPKSSMPFYGRQQELRDLAQLLNDPSVNLITILGAGGMGKTTFAIETARRNMRHFSDGVHFVPLAPLSSAGAIPHSLGERIGWKLRAANEKQQDDNATTQLAEFLSVRSMLIVLDNFEHLIDGAALVAALLAEIMRTSSKVKFLVTSRERLNLRGEIVYTLGGLPVPQESDNALESEAVQLFFDHVRRLRADFDVTASELKTAAEICRLVGGMPLALELAAGWMEALTSQQILHEIRQSIDILETELIDVPERHRSIRATFNYSWSRLTDDEQQAFMKLSVFRGGFSSSAAEAIAGANVRILRRLTNKSLISPLPSGRYTVHELLRQFAEEKLNQSGEYDATMHHFVAFFGDYMTTTRDLLVRGAREIYLGIANEFDNITTMLYYAAQKGMIKAIADAAISFEEFSSVFGRLLESIQLLERIVTLIDEDTLEGEDKLYYGHIIDRLSLLYYSIDHKKSQELSNKALSFIEPFGKSLYLVLALWTKGGWRTEGVTMPQLEYLEKAQAIALEIGLIDQYLAITLTIAVTLTAHGHYADAIQRVEEIQNYPDSSQLMPEMYTKRVLAMCMQNLGDHESAERYYLEILPEVAAFGELYMHANVLHFLSMSKVAQGDYKAAGQYAAQMLIIHRPARDWQKLGAMHGLAGYTLPDMGRIERAVEVLSFIVHNPRTVTDNRMFSERILADLQAHLPEEAYSLAIERSKNHTIDGLMEDLIAEFQMIEN